MAPPGLIAAPFERVDSLPNSERLKPATLQIGVYDGDTPVTNVETVTLAAFVAFASGILNRLVQSQMVVLGDMSPGGNIIPVEGLAETLQIACDSGGKRILLPMASVTDIPSVPGELFARFQISFYSDPVDAVFKALGAE